MICKNCNSNISDTAKFCPRCGIKVEGSERPLKDGCERELILCPKCGTPSPPTAKFCRKDGSPLKKEERLFEPKGVKPEAIIEPKPAEIPAEAKEVEKPPEKAVESDKPNDVIRPRYRASKPVIAIFQKEEVNSAEIAAPRNRLGGSVPAQIKGGILHNEGVRKKVSKKPIPLWIWLAVFVLSFTIAGIGSYLSFSRPAHKKPGKVTNTPEASKPPLPPVTPRKEEPEIEKHLPRAPDGEVARPATPMPGVPSVVQPHPPPQRVDKAKLEGDINTALRRSGLRGVSAVVSDDLSVVLRGSTGSAEEKNRAFVIAKSFKKAKGIRDIIFIVEAKNI